MRELAGRALRFGLVGILATGIHVGIYFLAVFVLGILPTLATALAFLVALTVSYLLNHRWTFQAKGNHRRYFIRYLTIAVTGATLNMAIMHLCTAVLGWSHYLGLAIIVLTIPPLTFLGNLLWGFADLNAPASP